MQRPLKEYLFTFFISLPNTKLNYFKPIKQRKGNKKCKVLGRNSLQDWSFPVSQKSDLWVLHHTLCQSINYQAAVILPYTHVMNLRKHVYLGVAKN